MSMQVKVKLLSTMQCRNAEGCRGCFCGDCKGQGAARFQTGGLIENKECEKDARDDSLCDVDVDFNSPCMKDVSESEERNRSWIEQEDKFQVYNFSQQPNTISSKDLDQQAGQNKIYIQQQK